MTSVAYAQQTKVSGVIISADDNEPVIGAAVVVKGNPSIGTTTDFDGKFDLEVPAETKTLVISYLGMKTTEVPVSPNIKVTLEVDTHQLGEVVVTGMQRMDKRLFTGATTKVDADKVKLDGMADVSRSLEGRVAGVSVQNVSGTFGTAPKIRVRGATSIYGNSRPLWVVDGVVMEDAIDVSSDDLSSGNAETLIASAIAGLNADDIESFQILKDGSATSIYGARAMAGVIVVTTKKGQAGVSRINYTGEFTYRMKPSYRDYNISNSQEQMGIYKEMDRRGWFLFNTTTSAESGVYGKMYQLMNQYNTSNGQYGLANTEAARNAYLRRYEMINTDWFDQLFDNNIVQNHAVSISSGTDKARFYISLSAMNDPGWTKSSSVERYTINANGSYNISPSLTLSMLGSGSYREQRAPGTLAQETDEVTGQVSRSFDINPYSYALNTSRTLNPNEFYTRNYTDFNILHELKNNYIDMNVLDLKFQGELNWKIKTGWEVNLLGALKYQSSVQEHHVKDHSNQANAYRAGVIEGGEENATIRDENPYLYTDKSNPEALPITVLPKGGIYTRTDFTMKSLDFRATTTYNTHFDDTHIINLFGGAEVNRIDRTRTMFRGWGFEYDNGGNPSPDSNLFKQNVEENTPYYDNSPTLGKSIAFFGSGTYSYMGKYIINGTARYEGTNKLGKSRSARWLPTWNISGAWNAHEEKWFTNPVLSHATAKMSYSLTADRGPSFVTNSQAVFYPATPWRPSASATESGRELSDTENKNLTYEKKHEFNFGIDVGFLNDRINFIMDIYSRRNYDLIGLKYTSGEAGGGIAKYANVASMKSSGIELGISTQNIVTSDFKWNTDFIFARATNKITDLESRSRIIDLVKGEGYALEGSPVRALYSIPFAGLNEEGLPTFYDKDGNVVVSEIDFQQNDQLDFLVYEGPTDPTITGSLGNTFSYKGFKLNTLITYSMGNVIRLDPIFSSKYSDLSAMPKEFKNRWVVSGDENKTNVPVIASRRQTETYSGLNYAYNAYNYCTERVAKGDFIRLKEVSISYDFSQRVVQFLKLNNLSLKFQATNLFLLYSDKKLNGQDPEFFNSGGVASPLPKQFTLSIRLGI
nr:SusC/RagA family TonB-linked outer membrane protein [Dysgonomonas sp. 520]